MSANDIATIITALGVAATSVGTLVVLGRQNRAALKVDKAEAERQIAKEQRLAAEDRLAAKLADIAIDQAESRQKLDNIAKQTDGVHTQLVELAGAAVEKLGEVKPQADAKPEAP